MSLFRDIGAKFEETKRTMMNGRSEGYVCTSCAESVTSPHEYCPHCGEPTVEPADGAGSDGSESPSE